MPASALLGNELRFQYRDVNASPNVWKTLDSVFDFGELGEEKPLVDISALISTAREYRGGLPDGLEIPIQANFDAGSADFAFLYGAYTNDTLVSFRAFIPNVSPEEGFTFAAIVRSWSVSGTPGEKSIARFGLKISGSVVHA